MSSTFRCTAKPLLLLLAFHDSTGKGCVFHSWYLPRPHAYVALPTRHCPPASSNCLRDGWGGFPLDIQLAVEKDKVNTCIQGEGHLSVVHCVPPFGKRHITQVRRRRPRLQPWPG